MHGRKAGVSFGPKGAVVSGGEPGTTGRCLELLGGERNREVGRNNRPFPALVQSSLPPLSCCTWGLCGGSVWLYMFKDPFSPDHTQKLEDDMGAQFGVPVWVRRPANSLVFSLGT